MRITYDKRKNDENIARRGLSFERVVDLEWDQAINWLDNRKNYGEVRFSALVPLEGRIYSVAYTVRNSIRVISFRKANRREQHRYEKEKAKSLLN